MPTNGLILYTSSFGEHAPVLLSRKFIQDASNLFHESDYINKLSSERINKLFNVLTEKELIYKDTLNNFDVLSFTDLLESNNKEFYNSDIQNFLAIKNNTIVTTEYFIDYLKAKSHNMSFINHVNKDRLNNRELTEVTFMMYIYYI